ncbi:hypothetical protein ATN89_21695 [Comamonas thiooxydans]|nr:hypothetical protein ATN89_21695 [Comamonas thiooxydans]
MRGGWSLRGYKGKGGGGGARQPVEAADSLHSTSYARVLDLLSEGEIAGLVNGLQSIYLNNTPLANADGSFNFAGVTADFRAGFQTQDPIPGFPSTESPAAVGVELKAATPWVRSILNRNLSAVRVTLGVDGLSKANTENGDISGHTVNYAIDLQTDGGAWVEVLAAAFTGKTTQQYRRTHRIDLPTAVTSWTLRVRRVTPNANSNTVADTTVIESITEVIDAKLRYPMSALVGLQVDASQFRGSVPTRAYHCRGRIIRVPSNYDPVLRAYTGIWDGTFKSAYSNNPAWVFYDLATNDRYGLGKRIPAGWINKWSLYQIGVYCDGMVSNGRGGVEPRFTCNAYLQSRGDATRVLQDLCSIFRGMVYWAAGAAVPVADMPRDPAVTYNQADVIDGRFSYSGSRLKDRHTVALVSYNDMTDFGRQKVFPYQDDAAVARYGIRKVEISAFGCTSEAQAQRVGQWAVLTAQRETRSVSFSLGLKGTLCSPGQVIEIADSAFAGRRMGGLVKSATAAKVVLDAPVTARAGDSITVMLPSGVAQSRRIAYLEMIDGAQHVSVNPAFDAAPVTESSWAISTADVATQLFTVLSVTEGTGPGLTFDVSAIQHEPGKFAAIDQGALLPERPVSVVPAQVLPTPIGVTVGAHSVTAGDGTISTTVTAAWQAVAGAAFYDVEWSRSQSDWVHMPRTALTVVDIPNAYTGDYLVRVRAISAIDTVSAWGYSAATPVAATALPPRNYDTFMVAEMPSGMRQYIFTYTTQRPPADLAGAEIRYILGSPVNIDWQQMRPLDDGGYYTNSFESTKPEAGLWTFALRARSRSGVLSEGMLIWRGQLLHNVADVVPDLTPPPPVTGLAAVGMFTSVQVTWDVANYSQGHGHARTIIYAAEGAGAQFSAARQVAEAFGGPASFTSDPATTWSIWAKHQSVDGVLSDLPAGPVVVETGQDLQKVQEALGGHISESWLANSLGQRIDLLDKDNGPLGRSLVTAAQQQDALNQSVRGNINQMAEGLLEAALAADKALERITDAGVYVDPATGQVKIYGLEQTNEHVISLQILLDAVQGQMLLKASTAYVDGKIAEAVLSPADLLLYEGIDARLITVTQEIDSINGRLTQKADALELQGALVRLTTAESNLDALGGQIALRVTRAEYQADQDALQQRMGSAELTLSALDVPAITATVTAASRAERDAEKTAEALLRDILSGERNREQAADALAFARNQLTAAIVDGLAAEAQQRLQLAATVGAQGAALTQESKARADGDAAEALARQKLAAETQQGQQSLSAAIEQEATARANAVSAEASQRQQLQATVGSNHTAAMQAAQAASDAAGSKGKVLYGTSAPAVADRLAQNLWIDTTGGANTPKRWNGAAWAAVTDKAATDAAAAAATAQSTANNAVAAIQAEQSVRANETGHLGALYSVRMQLSQAGQQVVGGFALSGTSNGTAGPTIDFGVMANSFWIAAPAGSPAGVSNVRPFSVQTTAQTINGVVVPAGVYMDAVYINNVDVILGRFGTLLADKIQATAISASQLTAGNGVIGGSLKSSNYVAGSSGWILRPDGMAEFSGVTVRGTIYSTAGTIGGITINGNGLNAGGFWGYVWPPAGQSGFHIGPNGILLGNANNGRYIEIQSSGNIYAPGLRIENGNATFSGNLSGASGTFSGTLTAQKVITTGNLEDNAAAVPLFAQSASTYTALWVPAFDGAMTCVVHYGGSFNFINFRDEAVYLTLYVDGGAVQSIVIGSLNYPGNGAFAFAFSGNGAGRSIELRLSAGGQTPSANVFVQATLHKR